MLWRIKALVDKFVEEVKSEVEADVEHRMRKEKQTQSSIKEGEGEVTNGKLELARREAEVARQELKLRMEKEEFEKEKSAFIKSNQDGALEITVDGDKYRCLRFAKANK